MYKNIFDWNTIKNKEIFFKSLTNYIKLDTELIFNN
jgi:hypothetical protein